MTDEESDAPWMALPMPTEAQAEEIVDWIQSHPDSATLQACYLSAEDHDDGYTLYCPRHASAEAMRLNHEKDLDDDHFHYYDRGEGFVSIRHADEGETGRISCDRCQRSLRSSGGLNKDGVRSELGLTETDPLSVSIDLSEVLMIHDELTIDDPRRRLWMHHAVNAKAFAIKYDLAIEEAAASLATQPSRGRTFENLRGWKREAVSSGYEAARNAGPMPVFQWERVGWLLHEIDHSPEPEPGPDNEAPRHRPRITARRTTRANGRGKRRP